MRATLRWHRQVLKQEKLHRRKRNKRTLRAVSSRFKRSSCNTWRYHRILKHPEGGLCYEYG